MRHALISSLILAVMLTAPAIHAQPTARVTVAVTLSGAPPLESRMQMCIGTSANRRLYGVQFADAGGTARFDNVPANAPVLVTAVKYGFKSNDLAYTTHPGSNNDAALTLVVGAGGPTCWGPLVATSVEGSHRLIEATAGQRVAESMRVSVRDQYQNQMAGVTVRFAVTGGGGSFTPGSMVTSQSGLVELIEDNPGGWRLGAVPGINTLTATVENLPPVVFTATGLPGVPGSVTPVMPATSTYTALAGAPLGYAPPMTVVVRDVYGTPLPGVSVAFAVTSGGGTLTPSIVATASDGSARPASWVLGPAAGLNTASATVVNLPAAAVKVYGGLAATSVQAASAVTQQTVAGSAVATAPTVLVKDQLNNPMPGISVSFAIVSGDGSVAPTTPVTTGVDGIARATSWMAGTKGPSVVRASVVRLPAVSFTSAVVDPFTLIAYAKRSDGTPIPSAKICVGSGRELGALGVKSADAVGRAIFTLPIASQYAVTAAYAGFAGQTILFAPTGSSGTVTVKLATGLIGATCPAAP